MPPKRLAFVGGLTRVVQDSPSGVVVARKTRAQVAKMPPALRAQWAEYEINNIIEATKDRGTDKEDIKKYLEKLPPKKQSGSPGAGPSGVVKSPKTERSPKKSKKSKKALAVPVTPVTVWRRRIGTA